MNDKIRYGWGSVFLVIGAMVSVTLGAALGKTLFSVAGPIGVAIVRIGIGALILCVIWRPWRFHLSRDQYQSIGAYGLCLGIMNLMFYLAIARLPLGLAIAIEFLGPLSVALYYSRRKIDLLWVFSAGFGVVLILPFHSLSNWPDPIGVAFAMAAAICWALYIILGKSAGKSNHAGVVTSLGMVVAFVTVLVLTAPFEVESAVALFSEKYLLLAAIGVGVFSSALPYSMEMIALRKLPERHFSLLMSLEPAIGTLIGLLVLREALTISQQLAVLLIVLASAGSSYSYQKSEIGPVIS